MDAKPTTCFVLFTTKSVTFFAQSLATLDRDLQERVFYKCTRVLSRCEIGEKASLGIA
jgi:hypothetical protein